MSVTPIIGLAADIEIVGALGMMVVSDDALGAGIGALPSPLIEQNSNEWFVWQPFHLYVEFGTAVGIDMLQVDTIVDSKAQRKFDGPNRAIVVMVETQAAACRLAFSFRMLVKLH